VILISVPVPWCWCHMEWDPFRNTGHSREACFREGGKRESGPCGMAILAMSSHGQGARATSLNPVVKPRCHFRKEELHSVDMANERRRVPRYSAHVKASIKLPGESTTLAVMVEDLCVLGCLLEYCPTLEIYQECDISLTWKGREFRTPAIVAWRGEQGQVGLEFHNTDPASQQLLREFCADFLMKPLVRLPEGHE